MRRTVSVLAVVALLICSAWQWLPVVQARWSIRDDYRFVKLMGQTGRISLPDFIEQLNPPDWHLGSSVNRPVYYVVHDIWMLLIGNHLHVWQSAKICTFLITISLLFVFFSRATDLVSSLFLTSFAAFHPAWSDVVPRANAELFAMLGVALYLIGNLEQLTRGRTSDDVTGESQASRCFFLVAIGGLIAVASKENFCFTILFCSLCLSAFVLFRGGNHSLASSQIVPILAAVVFTGLIAHGIISQGGHALYGETFDLQAISTTAFSRLTRGDSVNWIPVALLVVYLVSFLVSRQRERLWIALYEAALIGVLLLNFGFYTGLQMTGRYLFPNTLVPALAILPLLRNIRSLKLVQRIPRYVVLAALCIPLAVAGFRYNRNWSRDYRDQTERFESNLKKVVAVVSKQPSKPLVFDSYSIADVEPLVSVQIYLSVYGVRNPEFAKLNYSSDQFQDPHDKVLAHLAEGLIGPDSDFRPFSEVGTMDYFRITFSADREEGAIADFQGQE